jgi:hypothetical protein
MLVKSLLLATLATSALAFPLEAVATTISS